ncbi:unnamed protein product [Simian adenovirus 38]
MASVKFFALFASLITVIHGMSNEKITIYTGTNHTLKGPEKATEVSWYCYFNESDVATELCGNNNKKNESITLIKFQCGSDLTLINITRDYVGMYYGTTAGISDMEFYQVSVSEPTTPRMTTTTKTTPTTTTQLTTNGFFAMLQVAENSTSIQPTPPSEEIPKSMIGIIVAVVVCMLIIALCMVYYAFCYRKHRLNDKLEHLLSVEF